MPAPCGQYSGMPDQRNPYRQLTARKPWWQSRTLIFNALCAALATAEASFNMLQPLLPVNVFAILAFALPVGNAALRLITTTGVSAK